MVQFSARGYDVPVAGFDDASARSVLAAMQDRLARDPASAFGLVANATLKDVRAAFLALTKQFHPVRFGRMAPDIQRLSNEVFLALRAAYDALVKAARRASGPISDARGGAPASPPPLSPRSAVSPHESIGERLRLPPSRPPTPALGVPVPRSPTPALGVPVPRSPTPALGVPVPPAGAKIPPSRPSGVAPRDEAVAVDLLQRQQWDQARTVLHQLLARDPGSKRIQALMRYARGREAQFDRRVDDARVELQEALDLDPDLKLAKAALAELFTRRR